MFNRCIGTLGMSPQQQTTNSTPEEDTLYTHITLRTLLFSNNHSSCVALLRTTSLWLVLLFASLSALHSRQCRTASRRWRLMFA